MRAGLLRDRVTFQSPVLTETDYSASEPVYQDAFTTNARVTHSSGNKVIDASEIFSRFTVKIEIRSYHKVTPDMIVSHDGYKYRVLDINPERAKNCITITAELINE